MDWQLRIGRLFVGFTMYLKPEAPSKAATPASPASKETPPPVSTRPPYPVGFSPNPPARAA